MTLSNDLKGLEQESDPTIAELRQALARTQKQLAKAKERTEELVEATIQACKDATLALGPIPQIENPKIDKRRRKIEVALWHLTDWQGSKVTPTYNSEIMRKRVMDFVLVEIWSKDYLIIHHNYGRLIQVYTINTSRLVV